MATAAMRSSGPAESAGVAAGGMSGLLETEILWTFGDYLAAAALLSFVGLIALKPRYAD